MEAIFLGSLHRTSSSRKAITSENHMILKIFLNRSSLNRKGCVGCRKGTFRNFMEIC